MKKMVLGLVLALAALGLMASPAMAAPDSPRVALALNAADQAFLASLATAPALVPAAHLPAVGLEKALCNATAHCGSAGTISCSGNHSTTSCSATDQNCSVHQRGSVTCDGVTTQCPNACPCNLDCTTDRADCEDSCSPCIGIFVCSLTTCTESCHCKIIGSCNQF